MSELRLSVVNNKLLKVEVRKFRRSFNAVPITEFTKKDNLLFFE